MAQIQVRDGNGNGIARANIRIATGDKSSDEAIYDVFTDLAGNTGWPIPYWPNEDFTLHVNKQNVLNQYDEAEVFVAAAPNGTANVTIVLERKGSVNPNPASGGLARTGVVRPLGKAVGDDQGKHHFLGTTLFWMPQGFRGNDRSRAQSNIDWIASQGIDYFRTLGEVDWEGHEINPRWPEWEQIIGDVIDYGFSKGVRTQMTLVGGRTADHMLVTEKFANVAKNRAEKILYIEAVNEFERLNKATMPQMRQMIARLRSSGIENMMGLSQPRATTAAEKKAESSKAWEETVTHMKAVGANVFILHTDRGSGDNGWRMVRQAYDCKGGDEFTSSNQEGPGPASSVNELTDPLRLSLMAWLSWMCGAGFFTLHCGAGVTGLVDTARGRQANLWEVWNIDEILKAIRFVRSHLPEDVQNWRVVNNGGSSSPHPLRLDSRVGVGFWEGSKEGSVNKNYFALGPDNRFVGVLLGVKGFGSSETRDVLCGVAGRKLHVEAINPVTQEVFAKDLQPREEWVLPGRKDTNAGYIVVGQFT